MGLGHPSAGQEGLLAALNQVRRLAGNHRPGRLVIANLDAVLHTLLEAEIELEGLIPWSSNYTFLITLTRPEDQTQLLAVYKPCAGERPLWDFPDGTLCHREFASYLVSQVLGWPNIPPTVLRDGPHGQGSVQLFIDAEYEAHYFNIRHISAFTPQLKQIALFDYIVNNADRKGGHCLKDKAGRLWAIDHGLTFHTDFKLRTVIWEFCNEAIPGSLLDDLKRLDSLLAEDSALEQILTRHISRREILALKKRLKGLISTGRFPEMHPGRNVPFPPV